MEIKTHHTSRLKPIVVDGTSFALNGRTVSYRFHVDEATGDLASDHFGAHATETLPLAEPGIYGGATHQSRSRREFPDTGRGDFRSPAIRIRHAEGYTVSRFQYQSHTLLAGKYTLEGLPSTNADDGQAQTLIVHMYDHHSAVAADLSYTIFPEHDAIVRSARIINKGAQEIVVDKLASFSMDLPYGEYDMLGLRGDWGRECTKFRRRIDFGTQGFSSSTGYSSHFHNPFLAIMSPNTSETQGDVWAMSLIYSGSFTAEAEKNSQGIVRAVLGFNEHQLSWPLQPGEHLTSPECVAVFSSHGLGDMSRHLHNLYRNHLIRSRLPRPVLLNSWEGVYFDLDETKIMEMAKDTAALGIQLFVMDDGWFGVKHPRLAPNAGLGDWVPNPARFPSGLDALVKKVTQLPVNGSQDEKLQFGIWVEPEMVNVKSELYERHPDWVLQASTYSLTEMRNQLVLNLSLPAVQDYIIDSISALLDKMPISYVKWDNNRGIYEVPHPKTYHAYMLGFYRVLDTLTKRFPNVLWEGCAAGGGRFDPGLLPYFPQSWTSDNTDAVDRVGIQFGTTIAYPASAMGCHVSACPNGYTKRTTTLSFRAHVAMMGGSFGFELDPVKIPEDEREQIPGLLQLVKKVNPIVINGDMWRLVLPDESQHPAALYVSKDGSQAVVFAFQMQATLNSPQPTLRLRGLEEEAMYLVDGESQLSGATLMSSGLPLAFRGDYDSKVILLERVVNGQGGVQLAL